MKKWQLVKTEKHLQVSVKLIYFVVVILLPIFLLPHQPPATFAQSATETPTLTPTATDILYTPTPAFTPTITPTSIPTLPIPLTERTAITAANASQLSKFRSWQVTGSGFTSLSFSPDNAYLISTGNASEETEAVRFWNIQGQDVSSTENPFEDFPQTASALYASFSSDGQRFIALMNHLVGIWDVQNRTLIGGIYQNNASVASLDGDNNKLILIASGYQVALWAIPAGIVLPNEVPAPTADPNFDEISVLITASQTDEMIIDVAFDSASYQGFVLTADGTLYRYTYSEMRGQLVLSAIPQEPQPDAPQPAYAANGIVLDSANHRVIYAGSHNDVIVYDYLNNQTLARFPLDRMVTCIAYNPAAELLVIGDYAVEGSLQFISMTSGEVITQVNTGKSLYPCTFSPDNSLIATGSYDGTITLWGIPSSATS